MAGKGGARPGAGRKPNAIKYERPINKAEKQIADALPDVVESLLKLAKGVLVEKVDEDGGVIVYCEPPDRQAAIYLVNRILGTPTARVEMSGKNGQELFKVYLATSEFNPDDA